MRLEGVVTRRRFLLAAAGAGGVLLFERLRPWQGLVAREPMDPLGARLVGLLGDPESARTVGVEYVRAVPSEASVATLVDTVAARLPGGLRAIRAATDDELRALLGARTRRDFADEDLIVLQGWVLSVTEARLFALAALV